VKVAEAIKGVKARGIRDEEARDTGRIKRVRRDIVCIFMYGTVASKVSSRIEVELSCTC
jgi:hypothetical protein